MKLFGEPGPECICCAEMVDGGGVNEDCVHHVHSMLNLPTTRVHGKRGTGTPPVQLESILVRNLVSLAQILPRYPRPSCFTSPDMCLALPWEVIERVIDHSVDDTETLYSLALTCRDLNPRSTIILYRHLDLYKRDEIFALCDTLRAKPHLQPCVQSLRAALDNFSPAPLLRMLSNLSMIEFHGPWYQDHEPHPGFVLHPSVLLSCKVLGKHIRTLSLEQTTFRSLSDFSAFLLSFPSIQSLHCTTLGIKSDKDAVPQQLITQISGWLRDLRTLEVSTYRHHPFLRAVIKRC